MSRTVLLVPLLGLLWGLNWPAVRLCLVEIGPWTLRASGFFCASLIVATWIRARGGSLDVPRRHWARLFVVGLFSTVMYTMLSAFAQLSASTTRSAVLSYTMPIWVVILSRIVLREPIDRRRVVGLALGAAGLVALGWPIVQAGQLSWGLLFAVLSGVSWAIGSVLLKRYPIHASPQVIATWQLALGAVLTGIGMLVFEGLPQALPRLGTTWLAFLFHVTLAQAVATSLWFTILSRLPAGIASIGSLLVPAVGVVGAMALLGEHPTWADLAGLVLIVAASATVLVRVADPETDATPIGAKVARG